MFFSNSLSKINEYWFCYGAVLFCTILVDTGQDDPKNIYGLILFSMLRCTILLRWLTQCCAMTWVFLCRLKLSHSIWHMSSEWYLFITIKVPSPFPPYAYLTWRGNWLYCSMSTAITCSSNIDMLRDKLFKMVLLQFLIDYIMEWKIVIAKLLSL